MVDIKIPEGLTKSFTFTVPQAISSNPIIDSQPEMMAFPKCEYNLLKLQHMIRNNPVYKNIGFDIETIKKGFFNAATKSHTVKVSSELAEALGIPKTLPPFSYIKIIGDEKYLIKCNLVEANSSYSFIVSPGNVYPSNLLAIAWSRDGRYPELTIQSENRIINNLTLEILKENFEAPDFSGKEIIYILKVC